MVIIETRVSQTKEAGRSRGSSSDISGEEEEEAKAVVAAAAVTHLAASEAGNVESRIVSSTVLLNINEPTLSLTHPVLNESDTFIAIILLPTNNTIESIRDGFVWGGAAT